MESIKLAIQDKFGIKADINIKSTVKACEGLLGFSVEETN